MSRSASSQTSRRVGNRAKWNGNSTGVGRYEFAVYVDNIANEAAAGAHFGLDAFIRNSYRSYRLRQVMVEAATLQNARIARDLRRFCTND